MLVCCPLPTCGLYLQLPYSDSAAVALSASCRRCSEPILNRNIRSMVSISFHLHSGTATQSNGSQQHVLYIVYSSSTALAPPTHTRTPVSTSPTLQLRLGLPLLRQTLLVALIQLLPKRLRRLRTLKLQTTQQLAEPSTTPPNTPKTYVGVNSSLSIVNGSRNNLTARTFS